MSIHRLSSRVLLLCAFPCAMVLSCSAGPVVDDAPTASDGRAMGGDQPVAQTRQAINYCPNPVSCTDVTSIQAMADTTGSAGHLAKVAKDFAGMLQGLYQENFFKFSAGVLEAGFDLAFAGPDTFQAINCINQEIACVAQGLDWQITSSVWWDQYSDVVTSLMDIPTGFVTGSVDDHDAHQATLGSGQLNMFSRTYVASSTDGTGKWKSIITNSTPLKVGTNNVFDWGAGFSRFMSLIPRRVMILGYLDPLFATNGLRNTELEGYGADPYADTMPGYRHLLQQRLKQMVDSVRCEAKDRVGRVPNVMPVYAKTDIACADVNTGISAESYYVIPNYLSCLRGNITYPYFDTTCIANLPGQWQVGFIKDSLRRQVLAKLPIFEVQSMIDTLRRLTHPWVPELTQSLGRIPLTSNQGLCLDLPAANSTSGTAIQMWGCNGTGAQQWRYDRGTGTIKNTAVNKCLQVRQQVTNGVVSDNRSSGAQVEIWDCIEPVPPRQQWSYDQEYSTIRSALGTMLDASSGNPAIGTLVKTRDYFGGTGGPAQQWYSDRSGGYCQELCDPFCKASCVNAGPGTGSCVGGCMGGCVSSCPNRAP